MSNLKEINGAIFDLDGTLLDSMYIWSEIGLKFLNNEGITPPPGVEDEFVKAASVEKQLEKYHLDVNGVVSEVEKYFG